jgi:hypothetical protein
LTVSVAVFVTPAPDAVIVTVVGADGFEVVTKKPPPPANLGTVTYGGTLAIEGLLLDSMIWTSWSAGDARVTVPDEPLVPSVVVGERLIEPGACCGVSVIAADTLPPFQVAVIVAVVVVLTARVVTSNEVDVAPPAIVALGGTVTAAESLVSAMAAPPVGAVPFSSTIPLTGAPPVMVEGTETVLRDGGWTVMEIEVEDEPVVAVIVTGVAVVTCPTVNWNGAGEIANPAGTVTDEGTGAATLSLLARFTTVPPAGAALLSWIRPSSTSPLKTVGARVRSMPVTRTGPG